MKILQINCSPDLSYFTKRGVEFQIDNKTTSEKFPLKFLYKVKDQDGTFVDMYTPDVAKYLSQFTGYDAIMIGWNPSDYDDKVKHSGGFTCPQPVNGQYWMTVRQDGNPMYAIHELMHAICQILMWKHGLYKVVKDYMDSTPVVGFMMPFYKNDTPEDPHSNFSVTWATIAPYVNLLNKKPTIIQSIKQVIRPSAPLTAILTRTGDNGKQTVGKLTVLNAREPFSCDTLELPWFNNKPNVSCIPTGTYKCKQGFSARFKKILYQVLNVPNRSGVLFHSGNYASIFGKEGNTKGCILLGKGFADINKDGQLDVTNSSLTMSRFHVIMEGREFTLIIK